MVFLSEERHVQLFLKTFNFKKSEISVAESDPFNFDMDLYLTLNPT